MGKTNENDTDTEEQVDGPEPGDALDPSLEIAPGMWADGRREPKKRGKMLVYNRRDSIVSVTHTVPLPPRGKREPEQYERHELRLLPGINIVERGLVEAIAKFNPRAAKMLHAVTEGYSAKEWQALPPAVRIQRVMRTKYADPLEYLLERENDDSVREAIEDELDAVRERNEASDKARREERRRHRRMAQRA